MGTKVFTYFIAWLESELGKNNGEQWIDQHIGMYFCNGGPLHGAPEIAIALNGSLSPTTRLCSPSPRPPCSGRTRFLFCVPQSLLVGQQLGIPISLKLIHEVLASSGGLTALLPSPLPPSETPRPPHLSAEYPFVKVASWTTPGDDDDDATVARKDALPTEFGDEVCCGPNSISNFFDLASAARANDHGIYD